MKSCLIALALFSSINLWATIITSNGTGNWSSTSSWVGGVLPGTSDTVTIESGHTITLDGSYTIGRLVINNMAAAMGANDSELIINSGNTLTVSGNVIMNTTVSGVSTGSTSIQINGTLTISGNLYLNHTLSLLSGTNEITIGSSSNSGTLNLTGNLDLNNDFITALGIANQIILGNGTLDIDGSITMDAGAISLLGTNIITANDDGSYNGRDKIFKYGGNSISTNDEGTIQIDDANSNISYEFWWDGSSAQTIETDNITYHDLYVKNTSADVDLEASLTNTIVEGKLYIDNGATLHLDAASKNLDNLSGSSDKINILENGTLKLSPNAYADGIPPNSVITSSAAGYVEFYHPTGGVSGEIIQEAIDYPIVKLTGPGTKNLGSSSLDIDDSSPRVGRIWLAEGVFSVDSGKEISLNSSYGSKTIQLDSATTMRIDGNFSTLDSYWSVDRDNTVNYYGNSTQTLYELTTNGTTTEPYGILKLERTSGSSINRDLPASDTIHIANRLEIEDQIELVLNQNSYVKLLSNITYTAYIDEIASTATITYSGTPRGRFGVQKYLPLPYRAYRDLSSPIQGTTLESWNAKGLNMRGFTGSDSPGAGRVTVAYYDETVLDELNIGFQNATNTTNTIASFDGSDFEVSAWRVLDGNNSDTTYAITLEDTGRIYTGDQTFKLKFNYSNYDANSRTDHDGWNHVGNPYAAPLNWNDIYDDASNSTLKTNGYVTSTMYVLGQVDRYWVDAGNPGYYGFYNSSTETSYIHDSIIPAYQGFWVKAYHASSSSETYTLTIKESHKYRSENSKFYKSGKSAKRKSQKITDVGMQMTLKNGSRKDFVWFMDFPEAKAGMDINYDVPRFGALSSRSFTVDVLSDTNWLNLWVNALDINSKEDIEIPLGIKSNRTGQHVLQFNNIRPLTKNHCLTVKRISTGEVFLVSEGKEIPVEVINGVSTDYMLVLGGGYATTADIEAPKCAGEEGLIRLNTNELFYSERWQIARNGLVIDQIAVDTDFVALPAVAGTYKIQNLDGYMACGEEAMTVVLNDGPQVISTFSWGSEDTVNPGTMVTFVADDFSNEEYLWKHGNSQFFGKVATFVMSDLGANVVTLTTNKDACIKTDTAIIVVSNTTGIIENLDGKDDFRIDGGFIISESQVDDIQVFTFDGKLVYQNSQLKSIPLIVGPHLYCMDSTCIKIITSP